MTMGNCFSNPDNGASSDTGVQGPINVGVSENAISYSIPRDLKNERMTFSIKPLDNGQARCEFQIDGRQHVSLPFPKGAIVEKASSKVGDRYVVQVKRTGNINLSDYF